MRTVHCADAVAWLDGPGALVGSSVVTSLPDVSELDGLSLEQWQAWFGAAARRVLERTPEQGVVIFYQSDIKQDGTWVDKGHLCLRAAEAAGARLLWHKIVCRKPPGTTTFGRAGYAHLLCFSRGLRLEVAKCGPDVIADGGEAVYAKALGVGACRVACEWVRDRTDTRRVVDPFCGRGTVLAVANALGLEAVGVDISRRACRHAERLRLTREQVARGRII